MASVNEAEQGYNGKYPLCNVTAQLVSSDLQYMQQRLEEAIVHHQAGRLAEAEALYLQILSKDDRHADSLHLLGVIAYQTARYDAAIDLIGKAIALNQGEAIFHNNLGTVFEAQEKLSEAAASYERALAIKPDYPDALSNLGSVLNKQGRLSEAAACFGLALAIKPDHPDALSKLGTVFDAQERPREAVVCYKRALAIKPDHPDALSNLGNALNEQGKLGEAIACYERALAIKPDHPDALSNLGHAFMAQGKLNEAVACFERALAIKPDFPESLFSLGNALTMQEKYSEAIRCHERALAIRPDFPEALSNLGQAFIGQGKLEEAIACCNQAISLKPDFPECHKNLSNLKTYTREDPHIPMLRHIHETTTKVADRINACFALAKACEDMKQFDEAFSLYAEGNRLKKTELGYHIEHDRRHFELIRLAFDKLPSAPPPLSHDINPILIVGMPRSGTSLVEQILASHSQVYGAGELTTLSRLAGSYFQNAAAPGFDLAAASRQVSSDYLDELNEISNDRLHVTDKMPINSFWLGFLLLALPDIRIVHMNRDPMAVCWSNFRLCFSNKGPGFTYDLLDLAEYYRMYEGLMQFWRERFPGRIYDLSYEMLTENQEEETRKLLDYCGLEWDERCLEFEKTERIIKTASVAQVRRKMYQGSSDAWRKFEAHLAPLKEGLGVG